MLSGRRQRGFTLVELIFAMAILAVLVAIAVPVFAGVIDRANQGAAITNAASIANAINVHNCQNPADILTQSVVSSWASLHDMESSVLGDLCPKMNPEDFSSAITRVRIDENNAAQVFAEFN